MWYDVPPILSHQVTQMSQYTQTTRTNLQLAVDHLVIELVWIAISRLNSGKSQEHNNTAFRLHLLVQLLELHLLALVIFGTKDIVSVLL